MTYLLMCATQSPLLGVYDERGALVHSLQFDRPLSEALPAAYAKLSEQYPPQRLIYTHTPGSFMALKIAYCFFATAALAIGAELYGISAFAFVDIVRANKAAVFLPNPVRLVPIAALKESMSEYFDNLEFIAPSPQLPKDLSAYEAEFIKDAKPIYHLAAY